jgi:hypothetical protein
MAHKTNGETDERRIFGDQVGAHHFRVARQGPDGEAARAGLDSP